MPLDKGAKLNTIFSYFSTKTYDVHTQNDERDGIPSQIPMLWISFDLSPGPLGARPEEPVHEFSNNVVYATSKASDQPTRIRAV